MKVLFYFTCGFLDLEFGKLSAKHFSLGVCHWLLSLKGWMHQTAHVHGFRGCWLLAGISWACHRSAAQASPVKQSRGNQTSHIACPAPTRAFEPSPRESQGSCLAWYDPGLEVRQCRFHYILWVPGELLRSGQIGREGDRDPFFQWVECQEFADILQNHQSPGHRMGG